MKPLPLDPRNTRRDFLKKLSAAGVAAMMAPAPRLVAGDGVKHPKPTADACILLWMAGGMAAAETFDPKRYEPYAVGTPVAKVLSTFPSIDTSVDHIKISAGLPHIAGVMDRATLIRSHVLPDLGALLHSRHQYHWHTGYVPPQTVAAPHVGAWMARVLGPRNPVIPAFINIGQRLEGSSDSEELKSFTTAGFFGAEFGPMNLPFPEEASRAVRPPAGMDAGRFENRYRIYRWLIDQNPNREFLSDYQQESMLRSMDNAQRLVGSKERDAFDITREPKESAAKYGPGRFGSGCLLARRLVESGARFIEVTSEFVPFQNWDTHNDGHSVVDRMHREVDAPIAQLILDLESRGLLDRTLVIIASEFSRDMIVEGTVGSEARPCPDMHVGDTITEPKHYGLHRHFTGSASVVMFGGGMKRGFLHGETASERPILVTKDPVTISEMHATIFTAMGVSPKTAFDVEHRPFYATQDGLGRPVQALFA